MKKVLTKASKYLSPKGHYFEKGQVYELNKEQWDSIPDNDKSFFEDYIEAKTPEETEKKQKEKEK